MSENGRWQIAFWVLTAICGVWLIVLTNGVVANDRVRQIEDNTIRTELGAKIDKLIETNNAAHTKILELLLKQKENI